MPTLRVLINGEMHDVPQADGQDAGDAIASYLDSPSFGAGFKKPPAKKQQAKAAQPPKKNG